MRRSMNGRRNTTNAHGPRVDKETTSKEPSVGRQSDGRGKEYNVTSILPKSNSPRPLPPPNRSTSDSHKKMKLSAPPLETTNDPKLRRSPTNTNIAPPTPPDTPPAQPDSTPSVLLLDLPTELLLNVADHLPPDAILALNLTHSRLRAVLPLHRYLSRTTGKGGPSAKKHSKDGKNGSIQSLKGRDALLTRCARLNIRAYLSLPSQSRNDIAQRIRCIRCKSTYPLDMFNSIRSPYCISTPLSRSALNSRPASALPYPGNEQEVVAIPSRFCAWHVGSLVKIVRTKENTGRNEWVSSMREMCMHCGEIKGFDEYRCGGHGAKFFTHEQKVTLGDSAKDQEGSCESCGTRWVRTYVRYLNNDREFKEFAFWRDRSDSGGEGKDTESGGRGSGGRSRKIVPDLLDWDQDIPGRLFVREKRWDPEDEEGTKTTIDLPVKIEGIATTDFNPERIPTWTDSTPAD